jgi:hypothetical protein
MSLSSVARVDVLVNAADLRSAVLDASASAPMETRISRFCDSLVAWGKLPAPGRHFYGYSILDCLFDLVADIEDSTELADVERTAVELSLWQATADLQLNEVDRTRSAFIAKRRSRLQNALEAGVTSNVERLMYKWAALLRPRTDKIRQLPGPFRDDISAVVNELMDIGLPRRAKALASKFQLPIDPLVRWTIDHRPESEESGRTRSALERIAAPVRPLPYSVFVCSRALHRVLAAPLNALPMIVGGSGSINVAGRMYGVTKR